MHELALNEITNVSTIWYCLGLQLRIVNELLYCGLIDHYIGQDYEEVEQKVVYEVMVLWLSEALPDLRQE